MTSQTMTPTSPPVIEESAPVTACEVLEAVKQVTYR